MVHLDRFAGMRELALFAGSGGGILGGRMLGWRTVCAVEIGEYPRRVLLERQKDGLLDPFPIWDDVRTFDGGRWRGLVDVISGGFPCQDISSAGKGLGIERGERSGLWREYARIVRDVRPSYCFVENSPMLASRGLGIVLGDLAEIGYDAAWTVLSASDCGAPHRRDRMWILARDVANAENEWDVRRNGRMGTYEETCRDGRDYRRGETRDWGREWWKAEPGMGRVADGVANRLDRLNAIGNGQVPVVAARAFSELYDQLSR